LELLKLRKAANPSQRKKRKGPEMVGVCNNLGESLEEGNSKSRWTYDGMNDNAQERDESVGNIQEEYDDSDDESDDSSYVNDKLLELFDVRIQM
jgi:hypothetical protein